MINLRESEIRDESLSLTVAAYQVLTHLEESVGQKRRNRLMDDSFLVSSLIAEAFRSSLVENSENDIKVGLSILLDLKVAAENLKVRATDQGESIDKFVHIAEELQVELTELLTAIIHLNTEIFTPKLEIACI